MRDPPRQGDADKRADAAGKPAGQAWRAARNSCLADFKEACRHHKCHDLPAARKEFKPISHAVVALAAQVRSDQAKTTFSHFYCPMVKGGGGDWLQPDTKLLNPYYGSEMLRCGEKVHDFPPATHDAVEDDAKRDSQPQLQGKAGE